MIIYIEKSLIDDPRSQEMAAVFPNATVLQIDNYKNIFDIAILWTTQKTIVLAEVHTSIIQAPIFYGYTGKWFFLKNSLNCIYNCKYCYLQGMFKNDINVFFVNYRHIINQIKDTLEKNTSSKDIRFYSSDYSDNLATDNFTNFTREFIPLFSQLHGAKMEIRTKSTNISWLLAINPTTNVEIAFSLSPQSIIDSYEHGTPWLSERIQTIHTLLDAGWQVGIRFMPLIEVKDYKEVYEKFIDTILQEIPIEDIYSIFIGWILFTKEDYKTLLKKQPYMDVLYKMSYENDGFYRQDREVRDYFYSLFLQRIQWKKVNVCFDSI